MANNRENRGRGARGSGGGPLLVLSLLMPMSACDPEYHLCVVASSCASGLPIAEAHVKIEAYTVDGKTDAAGKICHEALNFPEAFEVEVDAPGFQSTTEGPFQLGAPGTTDFQATVCLDPTPADPSR